VLFQEKDMASVSAPAAVVSVISVPRCRQGEKVQKQITAVVTDNGPSELPTLGIVTDGRKCDCYGLEEINVGYGFDGRGFILWRSAESIAQSGPDADDAYQTFISCNGQDDHCSCTGNSRFGYCKHCDAIRGLIEDGKLEEVGSVVPVQPHPSPEQLLQDAMERPF
jgi:hypothetical protein